MLGNEIALQAVFFLALLLTGSVIDLRTRTIPDTLNVLIGLPYGLLAEMLGLFVMLGFYATYCCIQKIRKAEIMKSFPLAPFLSIGCTIAYFIKLGGLNL